MPQWYTEVSAHVPYKALGFLCAVSVKLSRGCLVVVNSRKVSRKASSSHPNPGLDICSPSMKHVWPIGLASLPLPYAPNGLALTQAISKYYKCSQQFPFQLPASFCSQLCCLYSHAQMWLVSVATAE